MTSYSELLPKMCDDGPVITNVAAVVQDGVEAFGLGVITEVWNEPLHEADECPVFDFAVCSQVPGRVRGASGFDIFVEHDLSRIADADLVALVPHRDNGRVGADIDEALLTAYARGATILAFCTSVFDLAGIGLLDGKRCTTHWRHAAELARRYPAVDVDCDALYVHDGQILTGAGSAGGLDACLHLMRDQFGARVAATTARRIVIPPQRAGGQAQYIRSPVTPIAAESLSPLLEWVAENLSEDLTVAVLARQANLSLRTFARKFRDETGSTPLQWVTQQRVALAEEFLEQTDLPIELIASRVGFGNAATLRHHFGAVRGTTPQSYRKTFSCVD